MIFRLVVFIHVVFVVGMCITNAIEWMSLAHLLLPAHTQEDAERRIWGKLLRVGRLHPIWGVGVLGSGLYLSFSSWSLTTPFVLTGLVGTIVLSILGAGLVAPRIARLSGPASPSASLQSSLDVRTDSPILKLHGALDGLVFGLVYLMIMKTDWVGSIAALGCAAALGAIVSNVLSHRALSSRPRA